MARKRIPDWCLKAFFGFAMAMFTIGLALWVYDALVDGAYEARNGKIVTLAANPHRFTGRVAGAAFAALFMLLGTLACLGWIPAVGQRYRRWLARLIAR